MDVEKLKDIASRYDVPFEDVLFIALNSNGVKMDCSFDRIRGSLEIANLDIFPYAEERNELNYYFALPVKDDSPFSLKGERLYLGDTFLGEMIGVTEDICNSHYFRRQMTSLNINANRRTKCHGCEFCYAIYQAPNDGKRLLVEDDFREFFTEQCEKYELEDLRQLIQISIVTGCYNDGDDLCNVLEALRKVASGEFGFNGKIFYLGSQITTEEELKRLAKISPISICFSIEAFERRDILRPSKRNLTVQHMSRLMDEAKNLGIETSFAYVLGLESLSVVERYFNAFKHSVTTFPTVNILQVHNKQPETLYADGADTIEYYLKARKIIEKAFKTSPLRPLPWSNYRSPWYLKFGNEEIRGIRTPGM